MNLAFRYCYSQLSFSNPMGVAVDSSGNVYVADSPNLIRKNNPDGAVSSIAGIYGNLSGQVVVRLK